MFGLGFIEIVMIAVVALVFIRPKDIPRLLSKLGRMYGQATRQMSEVKKLMADFEYEVGRAGEADKRRDNEDLEKPL